MQAEGWVAVRQMVGKEVIEEMASTETASTSGSYIFSTETASTTVSDNNTTTQRLLSRQLQGTVVAAKIITTYAGTGIQGTSGDNGPATSANLQYPNAVALDSSGNLYISCNPYGYKIRLVTKSTGIITTYAGTGIQGTSGDNGPATSANLDGPYGVALDISGNLYIADRSRIRLVAKNTAIITTCAGGGGGIGDNGPATSAALYGPQGVALDISGNLYIADRTNQRVRLVTKSTGIITTYAGTGTEGISGTESFSGDGGAATSTNLGSPVISME